jgi:hypothetical protein
MSDDAKHAADVEYWTTVATIVGFNELARTGRTLGEKVYFRIFRDHVHEQLVADGHTRLYDLDAILTLPAPPFITFQASDIELMREAVKAHDARAAGGST